MALTSEDAADMRAFVRVLLTLFGAQAQGDAAAQLELNQTLLQKVQAMSDNVNAKLDANDAKLDQLASALGSLEQRIAADGQKLAAAEAARDQAVVDLASTKTTLDGVNAELAAITHVDTSAIESRLQGESTKIQGAIDRLTALDVTPTPAAPTATDNSGGTTAPPSAPTGGNGDTGGTVPDAPATATTVDPNAPQGEQLTPQSS